MTAAIALPPALRLSFSAVSVVCVCVRCRRCLPCALRARLCRSAGEVGDEQLWSAPAGPRAPPAACSLPPTSPRSGSQRLPPLVQHAPSAVDFGGSAREPSVCTGFCERVGAAPEAG